MQTVYILALLVVPALAYEFWSLTQEGVWTWSKAAQYLGHEWNLLVQYVLGLLPGHFFVQPPAKYTLANYVGEWTEVAIVVWLGWGIFAWSVRYQDLLPIPWYASLALLVVSVLIGAFCWTLGA